MDRGGEVAKRASDEEIREEILQIERAEPSYPASMRLPAWINEIINDKCSIGKKRGAVLLDAMIEWAMEHYPERAPEAAREAWQQARS